MTRSLVLFCIALVSVACTSEPGSMDGAVPPTPDGSVDAMPDGTVDADLDAGPEPAPLIRAVLLQTSNTVADWRDLAYLAAIPASARMNAGRPVVLAADDTSSLNPPTQDFLERLRPAETLVIGADAAMGDVPSSDTTRRLDASDASTAALRLAEACFESAELVVLASAQDFEGAVFAASLAARLGAPLVYVEGVDEASFAALQSRLGARDSVLVNFSGEAVADPSSEASRVESLREGLMYLRNRTREPTRYVALTNVADRDGGRAQKLSVVAAMYAARRGGVVLTSSLPMPMDVMVDGGDRPMLDHLRAHYDALGGAPDYLALVGTYDAIPQRRGPSIFDNPVREHPVSDLPYGETDSDPFLDVAIGRIVSDRFDEASVLASRNSVYGLLRDETWERRFLESGLWGFDELRAIFENVGFDESEHLDKMVLDESSTLEFAAILHKDHSSCSVLGHAFDTGSPALLAPSVVTSRGCSVGGMDLVDASRRTVVDHMLGQGAVAFVGATRNSIAENTLIEVSFWNHLLGGMTMGEAFRAGINDMIVHWLDERESSGIRYSLDIEILYGDPALQFRTPSAPMTRPAEVNLDGTNAVVLAPAMWNRVQFLPEQLAEWGYTGDLFMYVGHGASPRTYWAGAYDREDLYYGVNLVVDGPVSAVTETSMMEAPLGWSGSYYVDQHADGTSSLLWRVRLLDYDMVTGEILRAVDRAEYELTF